MSGDVLRNSSPDPDDEAFFKQLEGLFANVDFSTVERVIEDDVGILRWPKDEEQYQLDTELTEEDECIVAEQSHMADAMLNIAASFLAVTADLPVAKKNGAISVPLDPPGTNPSEEFPKYSYIDYQNWKQGTVTCEFAADGITPATITFSGKSAATEEMLTFAVDRISEDIDYAYFRQGYGDTSEYDLPSLMRDEMGEVVLKDGLGVTHEISLMDVLYLEDLAARSIRKADAPDIQAA